MFKVKKGQQTVKNLNLKRGFGPKYSVFLGKAATTGNCSRATVCVAQASRVNLILLTPKFYFSTSVLHSRLFKFLYK